MVTRIWMSAKSQSRDIVYIQNIPSPGWNKKFMYGEKMKKKQNWKKRGKQEMKRESRGKNAKIGSLSAYLSPKEKNYLNFPHFMEDFEINALKSENAYVRVKNWNIFCKGKPPLHSPQNTSILENSRLRKKWSNSRGRGGI